VSVTTLLRLEPTLARDWFYKAKAGEWTVTADAILAWMANTTLLPELLETPTARRLIGARRLYVDEAQDLSEAMVSVIRLCLPNASVVVAGDTNQAINEFMGAADPVGNHARYFPGAKVLPLSKSWRFHQQIADAFNAVTGEACVGRDDEPSRRRGAVLVLCRSNARIDAIMKWLRKKGVRACKREKGSGEARRGVVEVSTVHRAKGGGWHTVVVTDDVINEYDGRALRQRLVATAVSRAREVLYVHRAVASQYGISASSHVRLFHSLESIRDVFEL